MLFSCTSQAGAVSRVHGSHWFGHSGRMTHAAAVDSTHAEDVRTTLHQTGHRETGELDRSVIALDPVVGSNLTPVCTLHI